MFSTKPSQTRAADRPNSQVTNNPGINTSVINNVMLPNDIHKCLLNYVGDYDDGKKKGLMYLTCTYFATNKSLKAEVIVLRNEFSQKKSTLNNQIRSELKQYCQQGMAGIDAYAKAKLARKTGKKRILFYELFSKKCILEQAIAIYTILHLEGGKRLKKYIRNSINTNSSSLAIETKLVEMIKLLDDYTPEQLDAHALAILNLRKTSKNLNELYRAENTNSNSTGLIYVAEHATKQLSKEIEAVAEQVRRLKSNLRKP